MNRTAALSILAIAGALCACDNPTPDMIKETIEAPRATKKPQQFEKHGVKWTDDYYWLREREDQEVLDYLHAENAYSEQRLEGVKDLRATLFAEMKGRIQETEMSVPYTLNGYSYYTRYEEGKEYPFHCRKKVNSEQEEIMLDVNGLAAPYAYYAIGGMRVSEDNRLLAFAEDTLSRRIYTLRFKDLTTGAYLPDVITSVTGAPVWSADNTIIFYTRQDPETLRACMIYRHVMGTSQDEDKLVYEEKDDTFYAYATLSKSREYIIIQSSSTLTSECRVLKTSDPLGEFKLVQQRIRGLEYSIEHFGEHFYIVHNHEAHNFKLSKTPIANTELVHWTDVVAHRPEVLLEGIEIFKDFIVLEERSNGLSHLMVHSWGAIDEGRAISFADPAYTAYTSTNPEFDTKLFRFGYSSLTTPNSIYDYHMETHESTLLKQQEVLGDFDPANYVSERIMVPARDGVEVPVSIVYHKSFKKDGNAPLLLYGYGSYGNSMDAYFSSARLSLLDRGFAFAIAHIRGGEEMGRSWYEDGKLLRKMNTFTDFIDCAEFLLKEQYTSTDNLFAMGGSAGGLLMGAVVNMRPDLWKGVVAQVPFVDVINTMLDASIPLTTGEYDEWGNPNDPEYFEYIRSYSPYDNVSAQAYPNMLVTTGLHDSQVQYWEPAKWVAKLRDVKTDNNLLLLQTEMTTGHGGASGRFERLKEVAMEYAFLIMLAGQESPAKE